MAMVGEGSGATPTSMMPVAIAATMSGYGSSTISASAIVRPPFSSAFPTTTSAVVPFTAMAIRRPRKSASSRIVSARSLRTKRM